MASHHGTGQRPQRELLAQLPLHSPFSTRRGRLLLAAWAALTLGILVLVVAADLTRAQTRLEELGRDYLQHVSDRALVAETAIEGFAAFVASLEPFDHRRAEAYAQTLLARYPFLYMFEVAQRVPDGERRRVEAQISERYPGFRIQHFNYTGDRTWRPSDHAEFYYPIVFQEPLPGEPAVLLGLDIYASDFLKAAMQASFQRGEAVATNPFELAEGGRGYVLHRSINDVDRSPPSAFESPAYALLALRSDTLFAALAQKPARLSVKLWHDDFALQDPDGEVLSLPAAAVSVGATRLLPRFDQEIPLALSSQPFVIHLAWQLGWADLSGRLLGGVLFGSLLLLGGVRTYTRHYINDELAALDREGRLYELANFDTLTGLANRNRLCDFLESALARARRHAQGLSLLFIDVDGFKTVNDRHGHSVGDLALIEVARRLSRHSREGDLLARYGGDEFVWVSGSPLSEGDLSSLIARFQGEFTEPFVVDGREFRLGVSVGRANYPDDGKNIAALIDAADRDMYRDKQGDPPTEGPDNAR